MKTIGNNTIEVAADCKSVIINGNSFAITIENYPYNDKSRYFIVANEEPNLNRNFFQKIFRLKKTIFTMPIFMRVKNYFVISLDNRTLEDVINDLESAIVYSIQTYVKEEKYKELASRLNDN